MLMTMRRVLWLIGIITLAACASVSAQSVQSRSEVRYEEGGLGWELVNIDMEVVVEPDAGRFTNSGQVRLRLLTGYSHGPNLQVAQGDVALESVNAPGASVGFNPTRDASSVRFAEPFQKGAEVTVSFRCRTLKEMGGRMFAVRKEGAFASWGGLWYPAPAWDRNAQPQRFAPGTTRLTLPAAWHALSTGRLIESKATASTRTETWATREKVGRSFICAAYVASRQKIGNTEVGVYLLREHADKARMYAAAVPPMVRILENHFGPYPFETFGIAEVPAELAPPGFVGRSEPGYFIAHQHAFDGDEVDVALFAHELTHMWLPNYVESVPPGDDMVDEAIANYGAALVIEATRGVRAATENLVRGNAVQSARGYFHLWRLGMDEPLMADYSPLVARAKGPWFYHMLRQRVGDPLFFNTWKEIIRRHARGSISLRDVRESFLRVAPPEAKLERFFADWLDRAGAPVIDLEWSEASDARRPRVSIRLRQRTTPYQLSLPVVVESGKNRRVQVLEINTQEETFVIDSPGKPTGVMLDPEYRLLLWRDEFGTVPKVTNEWSDERWRAWFDREADWLRQMYHVPGASFALIDNFQVVWAQGYGVTRESSSGKVDVETLFQAGDLSQTVSALTALILVKEGTLKLDEDVNARLRSWKIPSNEQTSGERVTLRRLLSHTAGLNVASFQGNTPAARVESTPGSAYRRSQGGYSVLQQLLTDVTGQKFDALVRSRVFAPLGLKHSTFSEQPAQAAAGLLTNAQEMAQLLAEMMKAAARKPNASLDSDIVKEMLTPVVEVRNDFFGPTQAALGLFITKTKEGTRIHYEGFTDDYSAFFVGFPETGQGCVVLTNNSRQGLSLAVDLAQRVGLRKGWPSVPRWGG
jgi:CubicO group peptidase (beta-lactamase class C family)